jgi:hypothetical protein
VPELCEAFDERGETVFHRQSAEKKKVDRPTAWPNAKCQDKVLLFPAGAVTKPIRNDTAQSRTTSTYRATLCTLHMISSTSVLLYLHISGWAGRITSLADGSTRDAE